MNQSDILSFNKTNLNDNQYEVLPFRVPYSMSVSEFGLIVIALVLILITLFLICIASNIKSSFKKKMKNLGVVSMNVNGKKAITINNLNTYYQPTMDLRTTSFMNLPMTDHRKELIYE